MSDRPDWYREGAVSSLLAKTEATVGAAQLILRVPGTGRMDAATVTAVRGIQRLFNLPVTGSLDLETAKAIDSLRWVDEEQHT